MESIQAHLAYLQRTGELGAREAMRVEREFVQHLQRTLFGRFVERVGAKRLKETLRALVTRETDPLEATERLIEQSEEGRT